MSSPLLLMLVRRTVVLEDAAALLRAIVREGRFTPVVVCPSPALAAQLEEAAGEQLRFVDYAGAPVQARPAPSAAQARRGRVPVLRRSYLLRAAVTLAGLIVYRARAARLFRRIPAAVLLVFEDRAPYPEMVYLAQARRLGCRTALVSFAASSVESDAVSRRERVEHLVDRGAWRWLKQRLARRYPHQVAETAFGRMLFFSLPETLALSALGMLGGRNWHYGGGEIELCTKITAHDLELARTEGAPVEKFALTGQPMMDAMHATRRGGQVREQLKQRYSLRGASAIVLCAVPHAAEHGLVGWERHLELTRELFRAVGASGAEVLLSLHPRSSAETYRGLAEESGCRILSERLSAVLPAADLFVASYSSTVRWALAMGIPTIMADFLQFRYEQFARLPGSVVVHDGAALEQTLRRLLSDRTARERMGREAAGAAGTPGRVCERVLGEIANLIERRK
jgi:hypothetical protein